ncbi:MAG: hypothetical protein JXR91_15565, partial [Deltaproteobacteria bacterium]|nr:hypothetical protein [Deltaproteobacteria bacterium]
MKQKQNNIPPAPKPSIDRDSDLPKKSHKKEIKSAALIILMAILSFGGGFLLVHFTLPRTSIIPTQKSTCNKSDQPEDVLNHDDVAVTEPEETKDETSSEADLKDENSGNATALPEIIPGPTPDGIKIDGAALYYKCWDDNGNEQKECERLTVLEKRMATRLYVVDRCKKEFANDELGLLSLGANLDFNDNTISFWSGPSSTIEGAKKIGNCVRLKLAGIPIYGINHNFSKYRIFFTIDFFDIQQRERELAKIRKKGREVEVIKDRVNVREEPVTGASLGRINSDSKVIFLGKDETKEWCKVLTP